MLGWRGAVDFEVVESGWRCRVGGADWAGLLGLLLKPIHYNDDFSCLLGAMLMHALDGWNVKSLNRRQFCTAVLLGGLSPSAWAAAQREETLSDDVASVMRASVANVNPPRLVFEDPYDAPRWLNDMSLRLARYVPDVLARRRMLVQIQYESARAGLDTQMILGLIQVESAFRQYAISHVGAKGLMQVMPFWQRYIGNENHNLFDIRTNLRYGCTILRHYNNVENGNIRRALARYNGSLGSNRYPDAVFAAWHSRWAWS